MTTAGEMVQEKGQDILNISPDTTIHNALELMVKHRIGAILVKEDGKFVGIWTERDLMSNTVVPGFDPKTALIRDYMTTELLSASHEDSAYSLFDKFVGIRLRHLLIEKDGEYIGIVSSGDVMRTCLVEKSQEVQDLNAIVSWDYYEDWKWKK